MSAPPREEILKMFREYDTDGSGTIAPSEIKQVMASYGQQMTDEQVQDLISEADTDGDGKISIEEFVNKFAGA